MNEQQFDEIVSGFYKAATGACGWEVALQPVQQAFGASGVILHTAQADNGRVLALSQSGGLSAEGMLAYATRYHLIDPRRHYVYQHLPELIGRWSYCDSYLTEAQVAVDPCFQELLLLESVRYQAVAIYMQSAVVGTAFSIELPPGRVLSEDERQSLARLGGHMNDALLAYERVRQLMQQALAGHQLLNSYPYPMWLLDAQRAITFENPAARLERERDARVAAVGERLVLVNSAADRRLGECLLQLHAAGHGATASVDLRPTLADAPLWLHLSLLTPGASLGAFGERPMVLATLFDPQQVSALDPFALAQMFRLTPAEAKVAVRLAEGLTAEQIGQQLHTSESTVRTHVRQILAKMGASRVTDVVRLLRQGEAMWALPSRANGGAPMAN